MNKITEKRIASKTHGLEDEEQLQRLSKEVEAIVSKKSDKAIIGYRPTYYAVLAAHGYLAKNTLGTGSYSKVKMALNFNRCSAKVAVKIIDKMKAPRDYQQKFLPRELKIWPTLSHPHLVALLDIFIDSWRIFMILEYLEGGDGLKYIQEHGAVSDNTARNWFLQIADAVNYMHNLDIAHRDLKLENLLLDNQGNIKICDFGFVRELCSSELSATYCGSKSYAAPEILLGVKYDPKKADIWAMGVILYIFVTGRMPFEEVKGTKSVLNEQRRLQFASSRWTALPEITRNIILQMFKWSYKERINMKTLLTHPWLRISPGEPDSRFMNIGKESTQTSKVRNQETLGQSGLLEVEVHCPGQKLRRPTPTHDIPTHRNSLQPVSTPVNVSVFNLRSRQVPKS